MSAATWNFSVQGDETSLGAVEEALSGLLGRDADDYTYGSSLVLSEIRDPDLWQLDWYVVGKPDEAAIRQALAKLPDETRDKLSDWSLSPVEERDWVSESQKLLAPVDAGEFFIYGSHDADKQRAGAINLLVEAGQAFGTGQHETTHGCLLMLSRIKAVRPSSALDLGCGSGILAMAIIRLWDIPVLASDIDPISAQTAAHNARVNDLDVRSDLERPGLWAIAADGFDHAAFVGRRFPLIVANILAEPLIGMAEAIVHHLEPGGQLILAGLLARQQADVLAAYEKIGLTLEDTIVRGDWPTLLLTKPATA